MFYEKMVENSVNTDVYFNEHTSKDQRLKDCSMRWIIFQTIFEQIFKFTLDQSCQFYIKWQMYNNIIIIPFRNW